MTESEHGGVATLLARDKPWTAAPEVAITAVLPEQRA